MKITIYIFAFSLSTTLLFGQTIDKKVKVDTIVYGSRQCKDCPLTTDTVIYQLLKCGLYLGSNGDIGYRTSAIYNDNFDRRTRYVTWIYGADRNDSRNGGLKEMKYVIDTASFQFLNYLYWIDKDNVYVLTPTSDGGTVFLNKLIDRKSFTIFEGTDYAKDKRKVYCRSSIVDGADLKTFRIINYNNLSELACDKFHFYQFGERLTVKEIKELKLDNFRK